MGGGVGAMTAACYLTSTPELRAQYEVTVFQQGWRIGGKGAAGRDPEEGSRILEHGLHIWLGFYDNAFNLIRACYDEWQKSPANPFQKWSDVFQPQWQVTLVQFLHPPGSTPRWSPRTFTMPELPGLPGDPRASAAAIDPLSSVHGLVGWLRSLSSQPDFGQQVAPPVPRSNPVLGWLERVERHVADDLQHLTAHVEGAVSHWALSTAEKLLDQLLNEGVPARPHHHRFLDWLLSEFQAWLHQPEVRERARISDWVYFVWQGLDYISANVRGLITDILPWGEAGFDRINHLNYLDWLLQHGIAEENQFCAASRVVFDLAFAYPGGVARRDTAQMAAGVALGVCLRMAISYRHAPLWRMLPGMGDAIFAPIHELLAKQRGVRFEFFHRVRSLGLSADNRRIESIAVDRQAFLAGETYVPLFTSPQGFPSWPNQPFWNQLLDGEELRRAGVQFESEWSHPVVERRTLELGRDFDLVVLGISVAGLKSICADLYRRLPAWTAMLDHSHTVQTQAVQLWMNGTTQSLGWTHGTTIMTSYAEPLDSWGEMSALLPYENWPPPGPLSLQYLCGVLPGPPEPPLDDPDYPARQTAQVRSNALAWLDRQAALLWPNAGHSNDPTRFDYGSLYDRSGRQGEERFNAQYWRANVDPSERYVLSVPGTIQYRLRAEHSGVDNLFLAGDWLVSSVNGGCVEAAVESGMAASRAICGVPATILNYPPAPPADPSKS